MIADIKKALEGGDADQIKRAMDALMSAQHKAAEVLYRSAQSGPEPTGGSPAGDGAAPGQGDVIDAEVVDEDKK